MNLVPAIIMLLITGQVSAQTHYSLQPPASGQKAPARILGVWGTAEQCIAYRHGKTDSPRLFPYRISDDWVRQGEIYCYLSWHDAEQVGDDFRVYALAQCGEDNLREYQLKLNLQQQKLRIRWSDDFTTRALEAC
ncbi:MAG: hypothetical protein OEU50_12305 [Gammaproteobacteria bacterium]|nr:hypothetical protein [Gammaproteobacteria bacterium]